jgi:ankyrin repeat protein
MKLEGTVGAARMRKRGVVVALAFFVALALTACASLEAGAHDAAFFKLVQTGKPQDVQAAIGNGADVHDRSSSGWTPLRAAAMSNPHVEVTTTLLRAGADVNARDRYGETPLIYAAQNNPNPEVVAALLEAGADINARDQAGWTALMYAAASNPNGGVMITTLLKAGADASVRDGMGRAAIDIARGNHRLNGNPAVQQLEEASQ